MEEYFNLYPIRCKSCNKPIANLSERYEELLSNNGGNIKKALDTLELNSVCCRTSMMNPVKIRHSFVNRAKIEGREQQVSSKDKVEKIPEIVKSKIPGLNVLPKKVIHVEKTKVTVLPGVDEGVDLNDASTLPEGFAVFRDENDELTVGLSQVKEPLEFDPIPVDVGQGMTTRRLKNTVYSAR